MIELAVGLVIVVQQALLLKCMRDGDIKTYKIGYYEQKLKNRGVDISHVENITLKDIKGG